MNPDDDTPTPSAGSGGPTARPRPSGADRARDEMIADIDGRLRRHENTVRESAGLLAETLPRLDDLGQAVAELTGRVDTFAGRSPDSAAILPVCWPTLTAEEAEKAWTELADWVGTVLGPWYQIRRGQVPDCWALHSTVMLPLSWLHRTWLAAHTGPAATPTLAAEWHVRWLPAALDAILAADAGRGEQGHRSWSTACRPGYHLDPTPATERGPKDRHLSRLALPHEDPDSTKTGKPRTILPSEDPVDRQHWDRFWSHAVATDLAWRRNRDSAPQAGGS